jgi:hypothetical protein
VIDIDYDENASKISRLATYLRVGLASADPAVMQVRVLLRVVHHWLTLVVLRFLSVRRVRSVGLLVRRAP